MGTLISDATTGATCGHGQTGSTRVFVQGKGVCRVGIDTAGGLINGPGSPRVRVEGANASLLGDAVAPHGDNAHAGPNTRVTQSRVFAG